MNKINEVGYSTSKDTYYNAFLLGYMEGYNAFVRNCKSGNADDIWNSVNIDEAYVLALRVEKDTVVGRAPLFKEVFIHGYYEGYYDYQAKCLDGMDVTVEKVKNILSCATESYVNRYDNTMEYSEENNDLKRNCGRKYVLTI